MKSYNAGSSTAISSIPLVIVAPKNFQSQIVWYFIFVLSVNKLYLIYCHDFYVCFCHPVLYLDLEYSRDFDKLFSMINCTL